MAIITFQSWEFGNTNGQFMLENFAGTFSFQTAVVRSGLYAQRVNPAGAAVGWVSSGKLGNPAITSDALTNRAYTTAGSPIPTSLFIRTYFQWLTKPAANDEEILRVAFNTGGSPTLILLLRSDAKLQLLDSTGTSLGVGATILTTGVWYRIELNANKGAAAAYELRINGVTELSGSANQTANDMALVILGKRVNRNGQTIDVYYDDFVVEDSIFPGPGRVLNIRPIANSTPQQWTAGTGTSGFAEIDEIPVDDDTTYIQNPGVGSNDISLFTFDTTGISGKTKAIQPWCSWRRLAGNAATSKIELISGATTVDSVLTNILTVYRANYTIFALDPNTGLPWKKAALTALRVGPRMFNNSDSTRCTGVGIFVAFNDEEPGDGQPLLPLLGAGQ